MSKEDKHANDQRELKKNTKKLELELELKVEVEIKNRNKK